MLAPRSVRQIRRPTPPPVGSKPDAAEHNHTPCATKETVEAPIQTAGQSTEEQAAPNIAKATKFGLSVVLCLAIAGTSLYFKKKYDLDQSEAQKRIEKPLSGGVQKLDIENRSLALASFAGVSLYSVPPIGPYVKDTWLKLSGDTKVHILNNVSMNGFLITITQTSGPDKGKTAEGYINTLEVPLSNDFRSQFTSGTAKILPQGYHK